MLLVDTYQCDTNDTLSYDLRQVRMLIFWKMLNNDIFWGSCTNADVGILVDPSKFVAVISMDSFDDGNIPESSPFVSADF